MPARGQGDRYQGSKWIRRERRLAIYIRDGMACAYCGHTLEDGAQLTLDHINPYSQGGDHQNGNLITACQKCNSSRGDRSILEFVTAVAQYLNHGVTREAILRHLVACLGRDVDIKGAKEIIARRGGYSNVMKEGI